MNHLEILIRILVYVMLRFKSGHRLSRKEKSDLLSGLYKLSVHFFSGYTNDKLGTSWMEISTHDNLCISDQADTQD